MARLRITAKDITEGASLSEEKDHLSEYEEDLSNVDADPSELMKKDKPALTLRFGSSVMSADSIRMLRGGTFQRVCVARPKRRKHPIPKMGSALCFMISLSLGFDFPLTQRFRRYCLGSR